jgi:peptide/nickel transport system substrate-binding protein
LIRRALFTTVVGALLVLLSGVLFLVFRAVVLAPETPRPGGTYTEGIVGALGPINPLSASGAASSSDINALLFEPLVRVLPTGGTEPLLASRWEVSLDQRSYQFTIRQNARWSDGSPVQADDVVFTVRTVQDAQFPGSLLNASWKDIIATALDSSHVRFSLPGRNSSFLASLELLDIIPAHLLAGRPIADLASGSLNVNPVGSGPFRLVKKTPDGVILERNPFGWRRPWLDRIQVKSFPSQQTALDALERGQIDGIANLGPSGVARASGKKRLKVMSASTYQYTELVFNLSTDVPYFQDRKVRQAIAMSIDKNAVIHDVLGGQGSVADGPIPKAIAWAYDNAVKAPAYDPGGARQLLEQAGWTLQDGLRTRNGTNLAFELTVSSDLQPYEAVAQKVAADLSKVGIAANVHTVTTASLIHDYLNARKFQMALTAFDNGPDPDVFTFWHSSQAHSGGFNFANMKRNVFIDKDLEDGRASLDIATRAKAYNDLQELFAQEVPAVYLYSPTFFFVVDQRIHGVRLDSALEPDERYAHVADWYIEVGR